MSKEHLEFPDLNIQYKELLRSYQIKGRVTRSSRAPNHPHVHNQPKYMESRSRQKNRTLQRYEGEPSFKAYLSNSNINYTHFVCEDYLVNKNMRRLNRTHLPESCILYEKNFGGHHLKHVKLIGKKCKQNQFIIQYDCYQSRQREQFSKPPQVRSINNVDQGILAVSQSLVFVVMNFQYFVKMFKGTLQQLKESYGNVKIDKGEEGSIGSMSQIPQKQKDKISMKGQPMVEQPNSQPLASQDKANAPLNQPQSQFRSQIKSEHRSPQSLIRTPADQQYQIAERLAKQIAELDNKIFSKMKQSEYNVLWPAVVIQPLLGQRKDIEHMISQEEAHYVSQESGKPSIGDSRPELKIFQVAREQLVFERSEMQLEKSMEYSQLLSKKVSQLIQSHSETSFQQTAVHLLGTHRTCLHTSSLLKWQQFTTEEINELIMKNPFQAIVEQLNLYIQALNKFKTLEHNSFEDRNSYYRISKYENPNGEHQLCIPIRCDQSRQNKKVLVRFISEDRQQDEPNILRWVEQSRLKVNFTVPRQNEEEKKFYYILGRHITVEEAINYIYADFYYKNASFIEALRLSYRLEDIHSVNISRQRCIYCHYIIDTLPAFRCKFCLAFCHRECVTNLKIKRQDQHEMAMDIYETDRDEMVWECEECSPCSECHMAVGGNYLKCGSCFSLLHLICGRLKGIPDKIPEEGGKYTCQSCLKCKMCSNRLKNQEYIIEDKNIFCLKCHKDFKNNEYCAMCMKEMGGKWVQCDNGDCKKWIHIICDKYFKDKENKQTLDKSKYTCPYCRLKDRRKIIKWVIEQLKIFDQFQYFYDAEYEDIFGYTEVIYEPMCIFKMRQKAVGGAYDTNTFNLIKEDLELIVANALTFNMPKDEPHYRAKILLIVGSKFLEQMKHLLECSEQFLVNEKPQQLFRAQRKKFYQDLYENYLSYLLNFRLCERTVIQVKNDRRGGGLMVAGVEQEYFSSKLFLTNNFANSEFKFIIKCKPHKIQNLFSIPRIASSAWWPIRTQVCYYHPEHKAPIIYECPTCKESYCCTTICLLHRQCTACGMKGCACDSYQCGCPVLREKEKKQFEGKISLIFAGTKIERREYSEYYKYCLKCVDRNTRTHWCKICGQYCYYNYEKCSQCNVFYHLHCEQKQRIKEMSILFGNRTDGSQQVWPKLNGFCYSCCLLPKNIELLKETLTRQTKGKAIRLRNIHKYLAVFIFLYEQNGIRVTPQQITQMVYQNYTAFLEKQKYFDDFLRNFSAIIETVGNSKIIRSQFKEYYMAQIGRKLANQNSHPHQRCVSFVETREMKELKQSKKFFKMCSKWFNNIYYPSNFANSYEVKYHLEHLTSKMNHTTNHNHILRDNIHLDQHMITTNFKEEFYLNYKSLDRIKIEIITSIISPKSKKNIYYTNKIERFKSYLHFWTSYYHFKEMENSRQRSQTGDAEQQMNSDKKMIQKQYEKYLRMHSDHQTLPDCIYKEESSKSLLYDKQHHDTFNAFNENNEIVSYKTLAYFKEEDQAYINSKSQMLCKYLSDYCLKIFEQNKVVLKKGSTCILSESENKKSWRVLKKHKNGNNEIKLEKKNDRWQIYINEWAGYVSEIEDIIVKIRDIAPHVHTFEDLANYMGFSMTFCMFYEPNHFTHMLQTVQLDNFNRKGRKEAVKKTYDEYNWQRQGIFSLQREEEGQVNTYRYNVTKKQIFYLKKRTQIEQGQVVEQVKPYITLQDIKKDLDDNPTVLRKEQSFVVREPTNDVYVAPSKIDRLGLFLSKTTRKGTIVTEYIGEVISQAMADVREKKFHFGCYMFGLTKNNTRSEIIDATFVGNMARYLNHSCDPNCKAKIQMVDGKPRILIYTIRDVYGNQELTYDYQFKVDVNDRLICKCKAPNCQGRLT